MSEAAPLLEIRGVSMHFETAHSLSRTKRDAGRLQAVDSVSLQVRHGEVLGLVGESGSGKSTLARCIVGLHTATAGEMLYDGRVLPPRRVASDRRRIQMVFQDPYSSLNPRMTVKQMLRELLRVHDVVPADKVDERTSELMALVGLGAGALSSYPRQFSGGQRQRVAIARALALEPELLVADEPISALDVSVQANILNLLRDLQQRLGLTMIFIAHNLAVVRHLCDRVAVMYLGHIVEVAGTAELFADPRHPYTQGLLKAIPRLEPGRASQAVAVVGDPPSPLRVPSGCRFHTRCPVAQPVCSEEEPTLTSGSGRPEHGAACHFAWTGPVQPHSPEERAGEPSDQEDRS